MDVLISMGAGQLIRFEKPVRRRRRKLKKMPKGVSSRRVEKVLRGLAEPKYTYEYSTGTEVYSTAQILDLTDSITQGDGVGNRDGDKIQLTSIIGRSEIVTKSTAAAGTLNNIRHIIFVWHPDDAIDAPSATKILYDNVTIPYLSPLALDPSARSKFTVLHDKNHILGTRAEAGSGAFTVEDHVINMVPKGPVNFNRAATSGKNKVYMLVLGNQATGNNSSLMTYYFAIRFKDV